MALSTATRNVKTARRDRQGSVHAPPSSIAIAILVLGAIYCLLPVLWVVAASTKSSGELFSTFTFAPGAHFFENLRALSSYDDGVYWRWTLNTLLYAGGGAIGATVVSGLAGYTLAKFDFPGQRIIFAMLLAGVLVPGVVLAVPQYFLFAKVNLTDTYWSVLLPSLITPYGIFLARIYAAASIPKEIIEAARTDGAGEYSILARIAFPMMFPGLVTIFLFQFVAIWNNFILPNIMLGNSNLFPLTVGLNALLAQGLGAASAYSLVIMGALMAILPLILLFVILQRFWRVDLAAGAVKN